MLSRTLLLSGAIMLLAGCTAVDVRPLTHEEPIKSVLIEENPKVWRSDFLDVLTEGFRRHGIESQVIQPGTAVGDAYVVRYTARQKWDMAMYLSDATIWMYRNDREIAKAVYHLRGGGGLSLMKWQGTAAKIDPVIDELLASVSSGTPDRDAPRTSQGTAPAASGPSTAATSNSTHADAVCSLPSLVDAAECRGELVMGMTTNEILKRLGRPDEMSADGTLLRYGDRYLQLDEKSRLVGIAESQSQRPDS
jgi:hypothetical protein